MTFFKSGCAALAILAFGQMAHAEDLTADTVLATVGDKEITLGHVIVMRELVQPETPADGPELKELYDAILNQLIQAEIVVQSADESQAKRLALVSDVQSSSLKANAVLRNIGTAAATEEAVQAAYDAEFGDFVAEPEFYAAHILVATEDEAKEIVSELEGGAEFAALARAKSTGPSGPNGGDLGWFGKGMMVPEFENAVVSLSPGDVSEPVQTQFGWHVVKLLDQRETQPPTLEESRENLVQRIGGEAVQARLAEVLASTDVERSDIEYDPEAFMDSSLLD